MSGTCPFISSRKCCMQQLLVSVWLELVICESPDPTPQKNIKYQLPLPLPTREWDFLEFGGPKWSQISILGWNARLLYTRFCKWEFLDSFEWSMQKEIIDAVSGWKKCLFCCYCCWVKYFASSLGYGTLLLYLVRWLDRATQIFFCVATMHHEMYSWMHARNVHVKIMDHKCAMCNYNAS